MKLKLSTVIAAAAVAIGGYWALNRGGDPAPLIGAANAQEVAAIEVFEITEGNPDAAVTVIEYASYTCPHCANFHNDQYQKIKENYIKPGKIQFIYREAYFDRPALWASMIGRCGGETKALGLKHMLFVERETWVGDGDMAGIAQRLRKLGLKAGLGADQVEACMTDAATAQALWDWSNANLEKDEIRGTPSFIINGEPHSNMSYADFAKVLDGLLADG